MSYHRVSNWVSLVGVHRLNAGPPLEFAPDLSGDPAAQARRRCGKNAPDPFDVSFFDWILAYLRCADKLGNGSDEPLHPGPVSANDPFVC